MDYKYVLTKKPIVQAKSRWYAKHRTDQFQDNEALVQKLQLLQGRFYDQSLGRDQSSAQNTHFCQKLVSVVIACFDIKRLVSIF